MQQKLTVYAPHYVAKKQIDAWLLSKQAWIEEKLSHQKNQIDTQQWPLKNGSIRVFNALITITLIKTTQSQWHINDSGSELTLSISSRVKQQANKYLSLLEDYLHHTLKNYIDMRVGYFCQQMKETQPKKIRIGIFKRRWGSCNLKRELTFNLYLASAPTWVIDYVIVHELAHLKYLNHSREFWLHVAKHDPNYKKASDWLKRHGMSLQWVIE